MEKMYSFFTLDEKELQAKPANRIYSFFPLNENELKELSGQNSADFEIENGVLKKYHGDAEIVRIPDGVTSICLSAFSGCTSLREITVPSCVTYIGFGAFVHCTSLEVITIPDSVTSIGEWAFFNCKSLTEIVIPDSVTSIGKAAFTGCTNLKTASVPHNLQIPLACFPQNCEIIRRGEIPQNNINDFEIKDGVLIKYHGNAEIVRIPDSVTSIGDGAFGGCTSLTKITIPNSVKSIGYRAFDSCTCLREITIPDSVTSIGNRAFYRCTSLKTASVSGKLQIPDECFPETCKIIRR